MHHDPYNQTIELKGRVYRYDPDFDCFYPAEGSMNTWDRWGWLAVIVALTLLTFIVTR